MTNAKLLSRAAEIIQAGPDVRETDGEVWDTARFEKACLDWLAGMLSGFKVVWCNCEWRVEYSGIESPHVHGSLAAALAKAVAAVHKQEKTK